MLMNLPQIVQQNPKMQGQKFKPYQRSILVERWYRRELLSLVGAITKEVESVLRNPPFLSPYESQYRFQDDDKVEQVRTTLQQKMAEIAERQIGEMANRLSQGFIARGKQQHEQEFSQKMQQATGIDVADYIKSNPAKQAKLDFFAGENTRLIKSIPQQYLDKVQAAVAQSTLKGGNLKELATEIKKIGGVTESRAKLIARDQTSKFNSALEQVDMESLGVTHYTWSTSQDERVRDSHMANEGKIFAWDDPPETGHPGYEINCRCVALPVLETPKAIIEQKQETQFVEDYLGPAASHYVNERFNESQSIVKQHQLTKSEAMSIIAYSGGAFEKLNKLLRLGKATTKEKRYESVLNKALDKMPIYTQKTHRVVEKLPAKVLARYKPYSIITEDFFTSSSKLSFDEMKKLGDNWPFKGKVQFIIIGKNGRDIENISFYPNEREVLFKSKAKFRVLKNETIDGITKIVLKEINDE